MKKTKLQCQCERAKKGGAQCMVHNPPFPVLRGFEGWKKDKMPKFDIEYINPACDDCQFEGGDHQTECKHYVPTKWDIEKGKAVPACLCAGLRRRNAGLCLKCEKFLSKSKDYIEGYNQGQIEQIIELLRKEVKYHDDIIKNFDPVKNGQMNEIDTVSNRKDYSMKRINFLLNKILWIVDKEALK